MKKIFVAGGACALLAALLVPGAALAQGNGANRSVPAIHDGVVVDAAGGAAYVMSPGGGIEARELASGKVLWKNNEAAKPLLVIDGTLVAQAPPAPEGDLVIVTLDSKQGTAKDRQNIKLPPGQQAQVTDGPSRSFRAQALPADDGAVIVSWTAEDGRSHQGIAPPEVEAPQVDAKAAAAVAERINAANRRRRGAVKLDLASGNVTPVPFADAQTKAPVLTARIGGSASKAAGSAIGQLNSLDGRHVLTSEINPGDAWNRYRWTITDTSGATVGTVVAPVSMAPFVVSGSRVVYVAEPSLRKEGSQFVDKPLRLRAVDLATGNEAWEAAVVDTNFRGPFPP